jgi:hypothetical protein
MSLDLYLRSKSAPSKEEVETELFGLGWTRGEHMLFEPTDSFVWFHQENYESTRGAWIFVREPDEADPKGTRTVFHGYTNAGRSYEDLDALNVTMRALRRRFGGSLWDPQRGVSGYLINDIPRLSPSEKACGFTYIRFQQNLARARFLREEIDENARKRIELVGSLSFERAPLVNNLLLTFFVASFEAFLKELFIAYVDTNPSLHAKVYLRRKKFDAEVVQKLVSGIQTLGAAEADQYTFQNIASAHAAYSDFLGVDLYKLWRRKRKYGRSFYLVMDLIEELLARRHRIVHSADIDLHLSATDVDRYAHGLQAAAEHLVAHFQREKAFRIDLEDAL